MTTPVLHPAGIAHAAVLAALHAACFDEVWDEAAFASLLPTPGTRALVAALDGGPPAGFVVTRQAADEVEVLTIGVVAESRRAGVAAALLAGALAEAAAGGAAAAFLEVAVDNAPALAFYAAQGFCEVGRRAGYYQRAGGRVDALVLSRVISRRGSAGG